MIYLILALYLIIAGLLVGWLAGVIFKQERPYGMGGDLGNGVARVERRKPLKLGGQCAQQVVRPELAVIPLLNHVLQVLSHISLTQQPS